MSEQLNLDNNVQVRISTMQTVGVSAQYKTIILKPNLDEHGNNLLTQQMMNESNVKYVIKYDYVLAENITVPANCVLEFDGGSISGAYTIYANQAIFTGNINVNSLVENIGNDIIYVKDFGCVPNTDISLKINSLIFTSPKLKTVVFDGNTYSMLSQISIAYDINIIGNNSTINFTEYNVHLFQTVGDRDHVVSFEGLNFIGDGENRGAVGETGESSIFRLFRIKNSIIKNCNVHASGRTAHIWIREGSENVRIIDSTFIKEDATGEIEGCFLWIWALNGTIKNIYIDNCDIKVNGRDEVLAWWGHNIDNININNCRFSCLAKQTRQQAVYIGEYATDSGTNAVFKNCEFEMTNLNAAKLYWQHYDSLVERPLGKVLFEDCKFYNGAHVNITTDINQEVIFNLCKFKECTDIFGACQPRISMLNSEIIITEEGNTISINKTEPNSPLFEILVDNCYISTTSSVLFRTNNQNMDLKISNCIINVGNCTIITSSRHSATTIDGHMFIELDSNRIISNSMAVVIIGLYNLGAYVKKSRLIVKDNFIENVTNVYDDWNMSYIDESYLINNIIKNVTAVHKYNYQAALNIENDNIINGVVV